MNDSTTNGGHSRKRPWLAILLTVFIPGLGHVYLRLWLRALLWLALYVTATAFLLPDAATPDSLSTDAFLAASDAIPVEVAALVLAISLFCIVDAYLMTNHVNRRVRRTSGEAPAACPNCGKDLDADLSFCHWCTTRLEAPPEEDRTE